MKNFLKGIMIGAGTIIPGISGGTMAIIVGLYETILDCVGNINKHFKKSFLIMFPIACGALVGIFILSIPLEYFCDNFPNISKYVFIISAVIGIVLFVKSGIFNVLKIHTYLFLPIGLIVAFLLSMMPQNNELIINVNPVYLLLLGFPLSLALVLPAVSFSYMLYYMGLYEFVIKAIKNIELLSLLPLFLGIALGTIIFSKLLLNLIKKFPEKSYMFVLGFVLYSIIDMIFETKC